MSTVSKYVERASSTLGKAGRQVMDTARSGLTTAMREGRRMLAETAKPATAPKRGGKARRRRKQPTR